MPRPLTLIVSIAATALLGFAVPALARGGGDRNEVRVNGSCSGGGRATLKLKADDGRIETELEAQHTRSGTWRVVFVQEGRVAGRRTVRARGGAFSVQRRLRDLSGADTVSVRASGPGGVSCRAVATLRGD